MDDCSAHLDHVCLVGWMAAYQNVMKMGNLFQSASSVYISRKVLTRRFFLIKVELRCHITSFAFITWMKDTTVTTKNSVLYFRKNPAHLIPNFGSRADTCVGSGIVRRGWVGLTKPLSSKLILGHLTCPQHGQSWGASLAITGIVHFGKAVGEVFITWIFCSLTTHAVEELT